MLYTNTDDSSLFVKWSFHKKFKNYRWMLNASWSTPMENQSTLIILCRFELNLSYVEISYEQKI